MTRRGISRVSVRIAIVAASVAILSAGNVSAQEQSRATCDPYPAEWPIQTIVVKLVDGDCKIDLDTAIPLLLTYQQGNAYWEVCNQCGAAVDVKIFGSAPNTLSELFTRFSPPIDASETSTARNISPNQQDIYFRGDVADDSPTGTNKYAVGVKFSTEGEGGWDELDPELQIDNSRAAERAGERATTSPSEEDYVTPIIAAAIGAAAGFGAGWWFGRRRVTL